MTAFIFVAALMVAVALAWLLWPLLRSASRSTVEGHVANAAIYRDQFADLDADLARGTISQEHYAEARAELERRLLDEGRADKTAAAPVARASNRVLAAVLVVAVPVIAGGLYAKLGTPDAFSPMAQLGSGGGAGAHDMSDADMDKMLQSLKERLQKEPDNVEGWVILARTYYAMRRFSDAAAAYAKLTELVPDEPDLLADYADALAMSQDRNLEGKPMELVDKALKLQPNHWKALAMAGTAAFDRKDYKKAVEYWERLQASQPADSPIAQTIGGSIAEARRLAGMPPAAPVAAAPAAMAKAGPLAPDAQMPANHPPIDKPAGASMPPPQAGKAGAAMAAAPEAKGTAAAAGTKSVSGTLMLSGTLAGKVTPEDRVFVYARPADGSKMPLAILRAQVKDLPLKFTLDDSMAMSPAAKISGQEQVVIAARISKGGSAMAQKGDLETITKPVKVGARDLQVTIDTIVP